MIGTHAQKHTEVILVNRSPSAWCFGGSTVTETSSELSWPPVSVTVSLKV